MATSNDSVNNIIHSLDQLPQARYLSLYRGNRKILGWLQKDHVSAGNKYSHINCIKEILNSDLQKTGLYEIRYKNSLQDKDYEYHTYNKTIGQVDENQNSMPDNIKVVASEYAVKNVSDVLIEIQELKIRSEYLKIELEQTKALLDEARNIIADQNELIDELQDAKDLADSERDAKPGFLQDIMTNPEKITPLLNTLTPLLQAGANAIMGAMNKQHQQPQQQQPVPIPQQQPVYQMQYNGQQTAATAE
jgi:hypothetical protein